MKARHPHLQQGSKVVDDVLRGTILFLLAQLVVGADDLCQLVCQIILTPAARTCTHAHSTLRGKMMGANVGVHDACKGAHQRGCSCARWNGVPGSAPGHFAGLLDTVSFPCTSQQVGTQLWQICCINDYTSSHPSHLLVLLDCTALVQHAQAGNVPYSLSCELICCSPRTLTHLLQPQGLSPSAAATSTAAGE